MIYGWKSRYLLLLNIYGHQLFSFIYQATRHRVHRLSYRMYFTSWVRELLRSRLEIKRTIQQVPDILKVNILIRIPIKRYFTQNNFMRKEDGQKWKCKDF